MTDHERQRDLTQGGRGYLYVEIAAERVAIIPSVMSGTSSQDHPSQSYMGDSIRLCQRGFDARSVGWVHISSYGQSQMWYKNRNSLFKV